MKEGLEIGVSSFKQLFNKFREGRGFIDLGGASLSMPIKKMGIAGVSPGGSRFSVIATIFPLKMPDIDEALLENYRLRPPYDHLKSFFWVGEEVTSGVHPNSAFVGDAQGDNDFLIAYDFAKGWLTIEMGSSGATHRGVLSTPDKFKEDMLAFFKIVTVTVNGLYAKAGQIVPNISFNLEWAEADEETEVKFGQASKVAAGVKSVKLPELSFDDLGGQDELKKELINVVLAFKHPEIYEKWGSDRANGYLLAGPPGVGKTLAARTLASNIDANFYDVNIAEIFMQYLGQSGQKIDELFNKAHKNSPSIIFFDEADALVSRRSDDTGDSAGSEVNRVVSIILTKMSDLHPEDDILVLAATNRVNAIDPAFLRAGRINKIIQVNLPDEKGRAEIFGIYRRKAEAKAGREIFAGVNWGQIAKASTGMSGAEIAEIIRRTLEVKINQELAGEKAELPSTKDVMDQIQSYERREFKKKIGFNV